MDGLESRIRALETHKAVSERRLRLLEHRSDETYRKLHPVRRRESISHVIARILRSVRIQLA